jgi:hypothetical protein
MYRAHEHSILAMHEYSKYNPDVTDKSNSIEYVFDSGNPLARDVDDNNPRRMDETSLYSLARCHNDLERLKQDAMVHCWMSEMTLLEDDIFSS